MEKQILCVCVSFFVPLFSTSGDRNQHICTGDHEILCKTLVNDCEYLQSIAKDPQLVCVIVHSLLFIQKSDYCDILTSQMWYKGLQISQYCLMLSQ